MHRTLYTQTNWPLMQKYFGNILIQLQNNLVILLLCFNDDLHFKRVWLYACVCARMNIYDFRTNSFTHFLFIRKSDCW